MANEKGNPDNLVGPNGRISPSDFMRNLRPEYYSDTEDRSSYSLDASLLEYQLESITSRNQTQDFEVFCRNLCQRVICPNLRPQTGPEGGGDSKADSETYPVADEISLVYVGEPNSGKERWAFAFSAKARWAAKVRGDVKGIVETGRKYDRILCVTSRAARSKARAKLEDELSKLYSIPVTIFDRSWIVKEIIDGDRKDLAFNYLHVGQEIIDPFRMGPTDYSRARQLADIEKSLDEPEAYRGMERQRVIEALVAAKLSCNLERPRTETDGRFIRAIRLANADGSAHQKLEAQYESIWSAYWWFDDINLVNQAYDSFEKSVLNSTDAHDIQFLCNLFQLIVNSVIHKHLTRAASKLDARAVTLRGLLESLAADKTRPNNALEAETSLLIMKLSVQWIEDKKADRSAIWAEFASLLERASGLGEFDAERLVKMIEVASPVAGTDPEYGKLIECVASFVSTRAGEAEGALILLKRAQSLDFDNNFEMIRLLGKATLGLSKREYAAQMIEASQLLSMAYRSAGLLWAARAACILATASLVVEGERESQLPVGFVPTMKLWAWIALELGYVPDFLSAVQLLNGALASLPLDDDTKKRVIDDLHELDVAFGSRFLTLAEPELRALENLPDLLEGLGLFMARSALLYSLGYSEVLREDGSLPPEETDEGAEQTFSLWASQPVAKDTRQPYILNVSEAQARSTYLIGMAVNVHHAGTSTSIIIAEVLLASLEAFFATALEHYVAPHIEALRIDLIEATAGAKPEIVTSDLESLITVNWPVDISLKEFRRQGDVRNLLMQIAGVTLHRTCATKDIDALLRTLLDSESVMHRITMIAASPNSYSRAMIKPLPLMTDWPSANAKSYPPKTERPVVEIIDPPGGKDSEHPEFKTGELPTDHRSYGVRSIIDVRAWDLAEWKGAAYVQFREDYPPGLALLFKNEEGARRIFSGWQQRFGTHDERDEIYIGIALNISTENPFHYGVIVASERPQDQGSDARRLLTVSTRSLTMEAQTDVHLTKFLKSYAQFGAYYVLPAVVNGRGQPDFLKDLTIAKHKLTVKQASSVGDNDIEYILLPKNRANHKIR